MTKKETQYELSWHRMDIEGICSFAGNAEKFTRVNLLFSLILGLLISAAFYGILLPFQGKGITMIDMFFHGGEQKRSIIPYFTVALTGWSLAILLIKNLKLQVQKKALELDLLPQDGSFTLTVLSAKDILDNIYRKVDEPKKFILLDRIIRALSNLKNFGNVSAVSECLKEQADNDDSYMSATYSMLKGFVWAIPVLGFIGTVVGLSDSVGGFGSVVKQSNDLALIKEALGGVTGGLGTAFETTLIALVLALIVQLLMTYTMNKEEYFLHQCSDYCHKNIIAKMKSVSDLDKEEQ